MKFQSKWVEQCVRQVLNKPEGALNKEELARIKYAKAGGNFGGSIVLELSLVVPPKPFAAFDGGDEWRLCLHSDTTLGEQYRLEDFISFEDEFWMEHFDIEEWEYVSLSTEAEKAWITFEKSIVKYNVFTECKGEQDKIEEAEKFLTEDLKLLSGLQVLRLYEAHLSSTAWIESFPELRVLELAEVKIKEEGKGVAVLANLQQVSIWCD